MNNDIRKLCMLLAAAGFDRYRVEDLFHDLREMSVRKLLAEFSKYEHETDTYSEARTVPLSRKTNYEPRFTENDTSARIVDLLTNEARLSVRQAFQLMDTALQEAFPDKNFPAPNSKMGISAWVKSLNKYFSESELLHVASRLRNQLVHGIKSKDDWALKE